MFSHAFVGVSDFTAFQNAVLAQTEQLMGDVEGGQDGHAVHSAGAALETGSIKESPRHHRAPPVNAQEAAVLQVAAGPDSHERGRAALAQLRAGRPGDGGCTGPRRLRAGRPGR